MGINFVIGCQKCQKKVWMYRGEEGRPLHAFFSRHKQCVAENNNNLLFGDDQYMEADWQEDFTEEEHEKLRRPNK